MKFQQILVLRNPKSTNIELADKHIREIQSLFGATPCTVLDTAPSTLQTYTTLREHKSKLGPRTLLCIAGGDGTVNRVIDFLMAEPGLSQHARKTVLMPLWAGNANDLAHMLNGSVLRMRLPVLFKTGQIARIYPLVCTITDKNGHRHLYHAASYIGFGISAAMSRAINRQEHRSQWWNRLHLSRLVAEIITGFRILFNPDGFTMEKGGEQYELHECSYVNGTRMGKLQPLAASLTERTFLRITVPKKDRHIMALYRWLRGSVRSRSNNASVRKDDFATKDTIWMQCDGEPVKLGKNAQVNIRCSRMPLYVMSTRLHKANARLARRHKK